MRTSEAGVDAVLIGHGYGKIDLMDVYATPGMLPTFWDRRVVFVANLLSLFYGNQIQTRQLRAEVGPLETYGGRLVPILSLIYRHRPNLLILERPPEPALLAYFMNRLQLALPDIEVLPHDDYLELMNRAHHGQTEPRALMDRLSKHPANWLDGFVVDDDLARLAAAVHKQTICTPAGSYCGNNKLKLHQFLVEQGLPVFDTHIIEHPDQLAACLEDLQDQGYARAVVKAQIGASGIGLLRMPVDQPNHLPDYLFHEGRCLVQGWLDQDVDEVRVIGSPSVQLFVGNERLSLYDLTEQILTPDSVHQGNVSPPPYLGEFVGSQAELLRQAALAGEWLHAQAYRGLGSVDFHMILRQGALEIRICEINARVTGATYPAVLARHFLPNGGWVMRNLRFTPPIAGEHILRLLDRERLLYLPGHASGVLPINLNTNRDGATVKGQFLCLGATSEDALQILEDACAILPVEWDFDRD